MSNEYESEGRLFFLDNLRTFLVFLVVLYHSGIVYESSGFFATFWMVDDPSTRFRRLMLPWAVAVVTLMPLYKVAFLYSRGLPQESWTTYFHFSNGILSMNWLWFLVESTPVLAQSSLLRGDDLQVLLQRPGKTCQSARPTLLSGLHRPHDSYGAPRVDLAQYRDPGGSQVLHPDRRDLRRKQRGGILLQLDGSKAVRKIWAESRSRGGCPQLTLACNSGAPIA